MDKFTQDEIRNLLALIAIAPIKGQEAVVVALLQQKLSALLTPTLPETKSEKK